MSIEKIKGKFESYLTECDHDYNSNAVSDILLKASIHKSELCEILEQFDGYDPIMERVKMEVSKKVNVDEDAFLNAIFGIRDIVEMLFSSYSVLGIIHLNNNMLLNYSESEIYDMRLHLSKCETILTRISNDKSYHSKVITKELIDLASSDTAKLLNEGMKLTKWVNRQLSKYKVFLELNTYKHQRNNADGEVIRKAKTYYDRLNELITDLGDSFISKEYKSIFYLSINPYDFLRMSNGNSWASCHGILDGCHKGGTISYALDKTSMILYSESDSNNDELVSRRMVHVSENKLIVGRKYGSTLMQKEAGKKVANMFSSIYGIYNESRGSLSIPRASGSAHYADYNSYVNDIYEFSDKDKLLSSRLVGHAQLCIDCGNEFFEESDLSCCNGHIECAYCGDRISSGNGHDTADGTVCNGCFEDDYYYCEECEEYHREYHVTEVFKNGSSYYICDECLGNSEYSMCDDCGYYHHNDEIRSDDSKCLCEDCFDDKYVTCDNCGAISLEEDTCRIEGDYHCDECYDDLSVTCVNCDDVLYTSNATHDAENDCYYCDECFAVSKD